MAQPLPTFKRQLSLAGITPRRYLQVAKQQAYRNGYNPNAIQFSTSPTHKLDITTPAGHVRRFGRVGYGDYIIWKLLERRQAVPQGYASNKRTVFQTSHRRIRGDWAKDKFSPNNLALHILW